MRRSMKYLAVLLAGAMALQGTSVLTVADEFQDPDLVMQEEVLAEEIALENAPQMELLESAPQEDVLESVAQEDVLESAPQEDALEDSQLLVELPEMDESGLVTEDGELAVSADPAQEELLEGESLEEELTEAALPENSGAEEAFEEMMEEDLPELEDGFAVYTEAGDEPEAALDEAEVPVETEVEETLLEEEAVEEPAQEPVMAEAAEEIVPEEETELPAEEAEEEPLVIAEEEAPEEDASVENAANPTTVAGAFADAKFQEYVKKNFTGGSNTLTTAQLNAIKAAKTVDLTGYAVTSLAGIDYFAQAETLKITGNTGLTSINLSKNTALVIVDLSGDTALRSINLSGCAKIQQLNISGCKSLGAVDVSACTALTTLNAKKSELKSLNVAKNTKLQTLDCSDTQVETLDVSANTSLRELRASNTMLSAVTLGTNTNLFYLDLSDNRRLTKIDVSKVTALRELALPNTAVVSLDLSNHASLYRLDLSNTPLKTLNLSGCKAIESLDVNNRTGNGWNVTTITTLNVSNCTALRYLYCSETAVNALTITGCSTLEELDCNNTAISSLTLTDCSALHFLDCSETAVTALDVSKNKNLRTLDCSNTGVSSLDVTNNESLASLNVEETGITSLDLRKNPNIAKLYCGRTMTKIYLNELKNNVPGTGRVILDTTRYNNTSARIIAYFPLNGTSWNKTTRNTYSAKSANITWWPYDPQTGTIYCRGAEEENGKKTGEHNWATVYDVKPNCSTAGKTHVACKACGEVKAGSSKTVKATGKHTYGKWTVKSEANAYSPAIIHKVCKVCSHEVTKTKGKALKAATTIFRNLQLRGSASASTKIKLTWNTIPTASVYYVYGAKCGSAIKLLKRVSQPKKAKTLSYTNSGLKAGTYYKYGVAAYAKDADGKLVLIESSSLVHVPTTGGKYTEYKKTTANRKKVTLKTMKTIRVKAAGTKRVASKTVSKHVAVRFESSNKAVVTVNKKGKLTAKAPGTAIVYAYMQDGTFAKIKVTVK